MNNRYPLLIMGLLTMGLVRVVCGQHGFDAKKKSDISVNTASLGAVRISGLSKATTRNGRAPANAIIQNSLNFPVFQQHPQRVSYSPESGLPNFITTPRNAIGARAAIRKDIREATRDYLIELKHVLRIEAPENNFVIERFRTDNDNKTHVRLNQYYQGIPIYGSEVIVHLNAFGEGEAFNGNYQFVKGDINTSPAVTEELAIAKVGAHLGKGLPLRPLSDWEKNLVEYEAPKATLCIYRSQGLVKTYVLAYHIVYCPTVRERWEYFVDASTGGILHHFESTCFVDGPRTASGVDLNGISRTINTYQGGSTYYLVDISRSMYKPAGSVLPDQPLGGILTVDMSNTFGNNQSVQHVTSGNNAWNTANQKKALTAHFNAGVAYEYFRANHGRNSIDGAGGTIISIVNVPDEEGHALDNAFWNGKAMFYGNGDVGFKPLAGAIDVAGHEMTHGVVQSTANLEYEGESGAINESMADIFGTMMDPADWLIGEDVVNIAAFPSGALRSLADPHNGGTGFSSPGYQPRHKSEAYSGSQDNGGVHVNSGIPNHAFYKYAEAITREKAADVFYKALDDYLTKSSRFIDLRLAVIKAAGDLFGNNSNEVTQAGLAFDFVGITNGQGGNYTETLPSNPGTEFLLVYNTDQADPNTLYRTSVEGLNPTPLTTTDFVSRPSITDKGDVAVFVAADHTIHVITTTPGNTPVESVLQEEQIWSNVVVSKGGTKIAAVTSAEEAIIYVYDFASGEWGAFQLYNPTYSEGVTSAGPVYADALEWDYTGEYLVYDCFNRIYNASGPDIEYWDVNFIHVWDREARTFSDGTIEKLFASLPAGVSIGNPSFAKNSPYIISFDYVEEGTIDYYAVLGCNIETNDVNIIAENNTLGWPSYNKSDARMAFTTMGSSGDYQTSYVFLNSDKISSSGSQIDMFGQTKWPVYFATGHRSTGEEVITAVEEQTRPVSMSCYPNPFGRELALILKEPMTAGSCVQISNSAGQRVYEYTSNSPGSESLSLDLEDLESGIYVLHVSTGKGVGNCKIVKK